VNKQQPPLLTGEALLQKVKELADLDPESKARACGYVTQTASGHERIHMMKFRNALLDAAGFELDGKGSGRIGRSASYRVTVQANGNVLIGSAYTRKMDLKPGDEFEITLGRKHIHLKQVEPDLDAADLDAADLDAADLDAADLDAANLASEGE
jgi:bifunctional DNA-binding transcriptional regulator/antitoxin component of YhaV-PrlF toxin-antitoxin module